MKSSARYIARRKAVMREFEIKFKLMADNGGQVADSQAE